MAPQWLDNLLKQDEKPVTSAPGEVAAEGSSREGAAKTPGIVLGGAVKKRKSASHRVIERPIITEKSLLAQGGRKYMFEVAKDANKISVKKAFFNAFGVMPAAVNILVQKGKVVRYGRVEGRRKDTKRAIVSLKEGQVIE